MNNDPTVPAMEDLLAAQWYAYEPDAHGDVRIEADWKDEDWPIATVRAEYAPLFMAARKLLAVVDMLLCIDGEEPALPENLSQIRGTLVHARQVRADLTGLFLDALGAPPGKTADKQT